MCVWVYYAVTAVAGAMKAYGQYKEGAATKKYYDSVATAQEAQGAADYARGEKQSELIQDSAKFSGKKQKNQAAEVSSAQRAAMAANGVSLDSVTSQDIASDTMTKARLDELSIRYNADINTWNTMEDAKYRRWAANVQAGQSRAIGKNALSAGKTGAFTTLLSTAASMVGTGMLASAGTKVAGSAAASGGSVTNSGMGFSNYSGYNIRPALLK